MITSLIPSTERLKIAAQAIVAIIAAEYAFLKEKIFIPTVEAFQSKLAGRITAVFASTPIALGLMALAVLVVLFIGPFVCLNAKPAVPQLEMQEVDESIMLEPSKSFNPMSVLRLDWSETVFSALESEQA